MSEIRKYLIENEKNDPKCLCQNDNVPAQFLYLETIL